MDQSPKHLVVPGGRRLKFEVKMCILSGETEGKVMVGLVEERVYDIVRVDSVHNIATG